MWVEAVNGLNTLIDFRFQQHFKAGTGIHGMGRNRTGANGASVTLKVPVGTQIFEEDNETLICDLTKEGQRFRLAAGGNGGFGNLGVFRTITWGPLRNGRRTPIAGETWVAMIEFGPKIRAMGVMSYGNSSQRGSPHRGDQIDLISRKQLRTLWTERAQVEANLEARTDY